MDAQTLAFLACQESKRYLTPGISEKQFSDICEEIMCSLGAEDLWYPMLVNFGQNTIYCTRGSHLPSSEVLLKENDIVLIDFSPKLNGFWGDYSETIVIGNNEEMKQLSRDAKYIFDRTYEYAQKCRTIGELFNYSINLIKELDYILLDPNGNIGHSIENYDNQNKRIYICPENKMMNLDGKVWAIEPHLGRGMYGAKFENVIQK
ncbi:M24 family metallopeptidase [Gorillibacterium massiliense]|uniref:M24 family metallopeptidase n=1 Tax=Gorillibacterium massiliense TaxID=1280390 RepID=UPI0005944D1B|nr:M24 family metallopeptidase [Gorillibacterium massiliense]